jgi:hypothetical protein
MARDGAWLGEPVRDSMQIRTCTVRLTNAQYVMAAVGQLSRDRCDCENGLEELKNQGR